jgi:hypothetical protein
MNVANMKRVINILLLISLLLILCTCKSNNRQNNISESAKIAHQKSHIDSTAIKGCLSAIQNYADTVNFDPKIKLYFKLKNEKNFSLDNCDVEKLEDNIIFQKSIIKIILKIYMNETQTDGIYDDLLAITSITNTTKKILDEYIYILYRKHVSVLHVAMLYSSSVSFIKNRDVFKNDKELMSLLANCKNKAAHMKHHRKHYY